MAKTISRRTFLNGCGILGAGAALLGPGAVTALAMNADDAVSRTGFLMNTMVSMTVRPTGAARDRDMAREAIARAFREMERHIAIFNRFDAASPLSVLNEQGRLDNAPQELVQVLEHARNWNGLSDGAFDPTILPLLSYVEDCYRRESDPGSREIRELLELVGDDSLLVSGNTVRFARSGMAASLDGVAKGYIVDRAADVLRSMGVRDFLINAGGDIACDTGPLSAPWRIAIQDPDINHTGVTPYPAIISLSRGAVATSGSYEVFYSPDRRRNHIIDPRQGISPVATVSATVTAATVMEADALATTAMVLPPAQALAFINSLPGRECLVMDRNLSRFTSLGWS